MATTDQNKKPAEIITLVMMVVFFIFIFIKFVFF